METQLYLTSIAICFVVMVIAIKLHFRAVTIGTLLVTIVTSLIPGVNMIIPVMIVFGTSVWVILVSIDNIFNRSSRDRDSHKRNFLDTKLF
jgi:hypothetical protein